MVEGEMLRSYILVRQRARGSVGVSVAPGLCRAELRGFEHSSDHEPCQTHSAYLNL